MKFNRRFLSGIAGIAAVTTLATACGPTNSAAISGKTPGQILSQAISKANGQKFDFTASLTLKADMSKVSGFSASQLGAFGPVATNGLTLNVDGTYESQSRFFAHIKLQPLCTGDLYVASYDGHDFTSTDGKTWYASGASSNSSSSSSLPKSSDIDKVGFKDKGSTTQDGQSVEDLRLDFNNALINQIAAASGQASAASSITQIVSITGDGLDIYIRPQDGLTESVKGALNLNLNVSQVVALLSLAGSSALSGLGSSATPPSGTLGLSLSTDDQFKNYGSASVTKPTASSGTMTNPCANLSGLTDLFGSFSGAGSTSPTPDLSGTDFNNISNGLPSN